MRRLLPAVAGIGLVLAVEAQPGEFWTPLRPTIERHLGRPYVWGTAGLKSFDCSGFVWRVMFDNGVLIKRTTARKLYMSLPSVPASAKWNFGSVVFFDNLKHCGLVNSPANFYHAQTGKGTNLSALDPYWRGRICGFRGVHKPGSTP
jgi:cell wall-associated NlpC family hydrolase